MSEQIYKEFFEEAMNQIRDEYIANGKERDFRFYFNLEYIEDTFDTITVSVPSEFMWKQMEKNGSADKIQQKINELTAQDIKLIPVAKKQQASVSAATAQNQNAAIPQNQTQRENSLLRRATQIQKSAYEKEREPELLLDDSDYKFDFKPAIAQPQQQQQPIEQKTAPSSGLERYTKSMANLQKMIEMQEMKEMAATAANTIAEQMPTEPTTRQTPNFYREPQPQPHLQPQIQSQQPIREIPQIKQETQGKSDYNDDYQKYLEQEVRKMNQNTIQKNLPQLRDDYTFDNFIPGANTQYAYSAAKRASEKPGNNDYNPMLIYGGVGLGKTHLMQAIGHYIIDNNPDAKICYISAESFTNEFIASTRKKTTDEFKKKYRNLDVLLLDDIQFLEGKEATQEELFHTFNAIYDKFGQLVFTCDRPIAEISGITKRLMTRFARGINLDLQPPDYETRRAILEQKITSRGKKVKSEIIDYIAQNVQSNVRDLESCMKKVVGYSELMEEELTLDIAKELLRDKIDASTDVGTVTMESIQQAVVKHYDLKLADLIGKKKSKQYVLPRQIAIYVSRKLMSEYSLQDIGHEFGGRDHSTILKAIEKVEVLLKTKPEIVSIVRQIEKDAHIQR